MGQMPRRKALRPLDSGLRRNDGFTNAAGRDVLMSEGPTHVHVMVLSPTCYAAVIRIEMTCL